MLPSLPTGASVVSRPARCFSALLYDTGCSSPCSLLLWPGSSVEVASSDWGACRSLCKPVQAPWAGGVLLGILYPRAIVGGIQRALITLNVLQKKGAKCFTGAAVGWQWGGTGASLSRPWDGYETAMGRHWAALGRHWGVTGASLGRDWGRHCGLQRGGSGTALGRRCEVHGGTTARMGVVAVLGLMPPCGSLGHFLRPWATS